tara:strand:+ start:1279 stop:2283 length:1005 start_codon:yes stop_codon:yes gene_type:complete
MLNNKSLLVTGGTGSFGKTFVKKILKTFPKIKRLVIFSRDELKQYEMSQEIPESKYPAIRYFIGDVRDLNRLQYALENIDIVVHAAALKQVPTAEYNPTEFIKTNVIGAQNIIEASIQKKVKKVIALSSDKATAPINLYGATKLCSDKLFVAANNYSGSRPISFSVIRYGNVMGSRGSIIPKFIKDAPKGTLTITDKRMTRFNISLEESVELVLHGIKKSIGGEIFIPKIPSYRITDLAKSIGPNCKIKYVGVRSGEKIHEEMITASDSFTTYDIGKYYVILPSNNNNILKKIKKIYKTKPVKKGFNYNSGTNSKFLSILELRKLIKKHLNYSF